MTEKDVTQTKQLKCNMVVVGGGGAGLAAAVEAAENGLKDIVVVEKRARTGGTSAMASGPFGANSPAQKRQGIMTDKEQLFKRMMSWTHLQADPRIVRAFIEKSGDTIRWLEDKGVFFYCVPHSPIDNPLTWHVSKGDGAEIMRALAKDCEKWNITVLTNSTAQQLEKDGKGRVAAVIAQQDGQTVRIETKSVVISTGGYAGNQELLKKYCPTYQEYMRLSGLPNSGEGLMMAGQAGAATDGLGKIMVAGPVAGGVLNLGPESGKVRISLTFVSGEAFAVMVNTKGRRFMDESWVFNYYECINALIRQPGGQAFALLDAEMLKKISREGLSNVPAGYGYGAAQRSPLPPGIEEGMQSQVEKGFVKISNSWDEIADWIGAGRTELQATVTEYNNDCDAGCDRVLAKERRFLLPLRSPPFYAIRCGSGMLNTLGGIKINEKMEVLDNNSDPIDGLFAAGVDTGGWSSETYCAILPGTAFGYALNSGRIAGESAWRYVSGIDAQ